MTIMNKTINPQKHIRRAACLIIAAMLAASFAVAVPGDQVDASSTEQALMDAREKQEELAEQLSVLRNEKRALSESLDNLSGELAWLNERSEEQQQLYIKRTEQLEAAIAEMELAYREYAQAEADVIAKQEQYVERVKTMFDHRNRSVLEVFLDSSSIQGFFTTLQFMSIVADTDQQMLEELEIAKDHADLTRQTAREKSEEMAEVINQLKIDIERIKADAQATELDMNQLSRQLTEREQAEADLEVESENVGDEVAQLQRQLEAERAAKATAAAEATRAAQAAEATRAAEASRAAEATRAAEQRAAQLEAEAQAAAAREAEAAAAREAEAAAAREAEAEDSSQTESGSSSGGSSGTSSSGWTWPVPGYTSISSGYGTRVHPVYGYSRMHTGIDIPAPYGHPVVAASSGVVILVRNPVEGRNTGGSGYGNYIVIDHGNGISTLYAHLRNTHVSPMQEVNAGDRVATIGSTGTSTGPHLHFEVLINGRHTNPLDYVSR